MGSEFVISSETTKASELLSVLATLVPKSQALARPPISKFRVGAVGLSSDDRIFLGVNLEFPGLPLHHSVHAEQFLITNLANHNAPKLVAFAVSAAPCGHCRQFLQEIRSAHEVQICITTDDVPEFRPLISILPEPFGPSDLLDSGSPLLLEPINNGLSLVVPIGDRQHPSKIFSGSATGGRSISSVFSISHLPNGKSQAVDNNVSSAVTIGDAAKLCNGHSEPSYSELEIAALEAANRSHAPYSNCPSGVALMDHEGMIYKGSYMESAAYNPSLGPVQAAIVAYVVGGGAEYSNIMAAVLVETEGAMVRQEETARLLLKLIAPLCELRLFHCRSN